MFPLMDKYGEEGEADTSGLSEMHVKDEAYEHKINACVKRIGNGLAQDEMDRFQVEAQAVFSEWAAFYEEHFSAEEKILMARTHKTAPTPLERCYVVHKVLVSPALQRNAKDFAFLVAYCVEMLSRFGSTQQPANVATKVFVRALRSGSSEAQWAQLMPVCKDSCTTGSGSNEMWAEMAQTDGLNIEQPQCAHLDGAVVSAAAKDAVAAGTSMAAAPGVGDSNSAPKAAEATGAAAEPVHTNGCCIIC